MSRDNPFDDDDRDDDYEDLFRSLARLLEELMGEGFEPEQAGGRQPPTAQGHHVDKRETDEELIFIMDAPGYEDSNLSVERMDDRVRVRGERTSNGRQKTFNETLPVPADSDPEDITVNVNNGIVEVRIPKNGTSNVGFQ